jgi:hypothetical protein
LNKITKERGFRGILLIGFFTSIAVFGLVIPAQAAQVVNDTEQSTSMLMMKRVETIVYGEANKGGLIERLNTVEKELFGRDLPGSISERHAATLNFLEVGTTDQPSMLFKLSVAEWIVGQNAQGWKPALKRVEDMEVDLDGEMQYGKPLAMRVERILASLVADPVLFQDVILPTSTVLKIKFLEELTPAKAQKGDSVALALVDDLLVNKVLVAPKGSPISANIQEVKKPRHGGLPSEIRIDFKALVPLGPQRPPVTVGNASQKATKDAEKSWNKGEGAMIGAGATSIVGAIALGPLGLLGGLLIRGEALTIAEGSITFVETSGDVQVSGYPVPESLRIDPGATIRESISSPASTGTVAPSSSGTDTETIVLPAEQKIN